MSDPEPIDLSQLRNLNLAPDWVGDLQKREGIPGEVIWGRAPEHERESRGGGQGQGFGFGGGGGRGPRRDGGGRGDFNRQDRGGPPRGPRQDDRGGRPGGPPRGDGPRGPRMDDRSQRPGGPGGHSGPGGPSHDRGPRPGGPHGDRGPRPGGPPRDDRRGGPGGPDRREGGGRPDPRHDRGGRGQGRFGRFDDRPPVEPLAGWRARLFAEPRSLEAITRQVKASGRAYPVFELGRLFLAGRDRYVVEFSRQPQAQGPRNAPKGTPAPAPEPIPGPDHIYHIPMDGSLWLHREDAIRHLINGPALKKFYRRETVSVDPPKGIFTAVAVCGFSGEILGPPNHHSFQTTVARLHREQFYNLPIDRYKARIRTEKDEALVAKWLEQQSTSTVHIPLTDEEIAANEAAAKSAAEKAANPASHAASESPSAEPQVSAPTQTETDPEAAGEIETGTSDAGSSPASGSAISAEPEAAAATTESVASTADAADAPAETEPAPEEAPGAVETANEMAPEESGSAESPAPAAQAPATEPLKNWAAVEAHFLAHHADRAVRAVSRIKVPGNIPGKLLAPSLLALLRVEVEQQQRFPMQLVQDLCRDLEKESLKFFKRDKKATFVCRTRPHFIDDESHLSPRLRSIVGVVRANPGITVAKLVSVLAPNPEKPAATKDPVSPAASASPTPTAPPEAESTPVSPSEEAAPAPETAPANEHSSESITPSAETHTPTAPGDATTPLEASSPAVAEETAPASGAAGEPAGDAESSTASQTEAIHPAATTETTAPASGDPLSAGNDREGRGPRNQKKQKPAPAPEAPPAPLTAGEIGVLQDLRWLVQEGFVTEFATSELHILGRPPQPPAEKKPKAENRPHASPAAAASSDAPATPATPESTKAAPEAAPETPPSDTGITEDLPGDIGSDDTKPTETETPAITTEDRSPALESAQVPEAPAPEGGAPEKDEAIHP